MTQTVTIKRVNNLQENKPLEPTAVDADVFGKLGVHSSVTGNGLFTVSHIPTGMAIERDLTRQQALSLVALIGHLDWTSRISRSPNVTPANPEFQPIPCLKCQQPATRVSANPAGGQRYRCRSCKRGFVHGGPGRSRLARFKALEALRLFELGSSIRSACRETGIAKGTGRELFARWAELRHQELSAGELAGRGEG